MFHKSSERGQALILIALAAIGLFAFAALAIDGSRSFSNKRHAQNAADTAVLTAALKYIRTGSYTVAQTEAVNRVNSNGYVDDADASDGYTTLVDVDMCDNVIDKDAAGNEIPIPGDMKVDSAGVPILSAGKFIPLPCEGISGPASEYIRVKIISEIPATFGRVIGRQTLKSAVEAVARVHGTASSSSLPDEAVVALTETGCGICANGNGGIEVHGSSVFSNSSTTSGSTRCTGPEDNFSMHLKTNFDPFAEGGFISPGSGCLSSTGEFETGSGQWKTGAKKTNVDYDVPAPSISCGAEALPDSADPSDPNIITVHSGWHSSKLPTKSGTTYIFEPGNHCLLAGINLNATVANIKNVNFKVEADEFRLKIGDLTCENMLVYVNGGTGVTFEGNGNITCTGATFYAQTGDVKWTGNPNMTLSAPTSGTYQGLLIYLPDDPTPSFPANSSAVKIGGTSNIQVTGSIIAPLSPIHLSGTSNSNGFDTQVVGNKIFLEGTSNTLIKYNPANQFHPPAKPTIDLTK